MHRLHLFFDFEHAARYAGAAHSSAIFQNGGHVHNDGVAVDLPVLGPSCIFFADDAEVFVLQRCAGREACQNFDQLVVLCFRMSVELAIHSGAKEGNQAAFFILLNGVSGIPRIAKGIEAACRGLDPRTKVTRHISV